jgi:hypothetical protein
VPGKNLTHRRLLYVRELIIGWHEPVQVQTKLASTCSYVFFVNGVSVDVAGFGPSTIEVSAAPISEGLSRSLPMTPILTSFLGRPSCLLRAPPPCRSRCSARTGARASRGCRPMWTSAAPTARPTPPGSTLSRDPAAAGLAYQRLRRLCRRCVNSFPPGDWTMPGYDDSAWGSAITYGYPSGDGPTAPYIGSDGSSESICRKVGGAGHIKARRVDCRLGDPSVRFNCLRAMAGGHPVR